MFLRNIMGFFKHFNLHAHDSQALNKAVLLRKKHVSYKTHGVNSVIIMFPYFH